MNPFQQEAAQSRIEPDPDKAAKNDEFEYPSYAVEQFILLAGLGLAPYAMSVSLGLFLTWAVYVVFTCLACKNQMNHAKLDEDAYDGMWGVHAIRELGRGKLAVCIAVLASVSSLVAYYEGHYVIGATVAFATVFKAYMRRNVVRYIFETLHTEGAEMLEDGLNNEDAVQLTVQPLFAPPVLCVANKATREKIGVEAGGHVEIITDSGSFAREIKMVPKDIADSSDGLIFLSVADIQAYGIISGKVRVKPIEGDFRPV